MSEPAFFGLFRGRSKRKSPRRGFQKREAAAHVEQLEPRWLLAAPQVDSVTKFGAEGQTITVWGQNFDPTATVDFSYYTTPSTVAYHDTTTVTYVSPTELTVTLPSGSSPLTAPGLYDIAVTTSGGTSSLPAYDPAVADIPERFAFVSSLAPAVVAATEATANVASISGTFSIPVKSTADFTPTGNLFVETINGVATVSYTSVDGTDFNGCTVATSPSVDPFHVGADVTASSIQTPYGSVFQAPASFTDPVATYDYTIKNETNLPAAAQNAVSYAMLWTSPVGGTQYYLDNGKFAPVSSLNSGSYLPTYSVPGSGGSITIKLPYIPINSGRIYFGVGTPPQLMVNVSHGVAEPIAKDTNSIFDYIEPTLDAAGADNTVPGGYRLQPTLHIDTSQVDQFGMPITLTGINYGVTPTLTSVGVTLSNNVARDAIFNAYNAFTSQTPGDPYNSLLMKSGNPDQPYRILNPSFAPLGQSDALSYAFDAAMKNLFEGTETLSLAVGSDNYTGTAATFNGYKVLKFTCTNNPAITDPLYVYAPFFSTNAPTSASLSPDASVYTGAPAAPSWLTAAETPGAMVLGNNGVFTDAATQTNTYTAQEQSDLAQIENQIVVALNRGVANLYSTTAEWTNPASGFYPVGQVSNEYAQFMHNYSINGTPIFIDGKAYAISYDDQGNFSSSITVQNQSSVTTTLGAWQTPGPAGDNDGFLTAVYQDVLHRAVDPSGHTYWLGLLSGGISRADVSFAIVNSVEHRTDIIEGFYTSLLNRSADAQGLNQCLQLFAAGWTASQIKCVIYGSQEYFQTQGGGTNSGFINALYQDELHRAADSQALTAIGQALAAGQTRTYIASLVVGSPEAEIDRVNKYYLDYLLRPADPAGLAYWNSVLARTDSDSIVEAGLIGSAEFYNRA